MKDRTHDQDLDKLSRYDQDVLHQLAFVARETLAEQGIIFSIEY